jgi:hypothetical protein
LRPTEERQLALHDEFAANPLFFEQFGRLGKRFAKRQALAIGGFPSISLRAVLTREAANKVLALELYFCEKQGCEGGQRGGKRILLARYHVANTTVRRKASRFSWCRRVESGHR